MTNVSPQVHFDEYLALLRTVYPAINGLIVFDCDARLVWQGSDSAVDAEQIQSLLPNFIRGDADSQFQNLLNGSSGELVKLKNQREQVTLVACLCRKPSDRSEEKSLAGRKTFALLSEFLLADYSQNIDLANKEDELMLMTDELTRRYEELNLIYKSEEQASHVHHGRELLRQLVLSTARFLSVDIIYLYMAGLNVSMRKFRNDNPIFHADVLFKCLRADIHPALQADVRSVVVNHSEGKQRLGIDAGLPFKFVASPVVDDEGNTIGLLATANQEFAIEDFSNSDRNLLDVMAKKVSMIVQSHFDPLTGLENSHSFELILKDLLKQVTGRQARHALANIDIDRMAVVNDISGREAGDHIIKAIAAKLADLMRTQDLVARLGSDKFGVLLRNCDMATADVIMKKISHAISSLDIEWQGKRHDISVSIGIAPVNPQIESVTNLLDAAETARNVSKQRGRNNIHALEEDDSSLLRRKEQIRWVGRIQEALRDNRFQLYAQLIEPMHSRTSRQHYEILLRLRETDGTVIAPGAFVPAAESFYLMANLDQWVINQAFHEIAEMYRRPCPRRYQISINLSGQSLSDPYNLSSYIENKLEEYEIEGSDICFEITESAAIANLDEAAAFIEQIRELGCKFSLDDFGTGLSSFTYLKKLKVDYLKIDGSFVRDIVADPVSESMVAAINQVGKAMQLETVAEYVENDEIKQLLKNIGVDFGQGYGIGRPVLFRDIQDKFEESA
ncbi:MAG: EAL domain-containing protein [Gammaproteobacteria bacterium]|nr:EAL domain-containing protein [Gammaproteobacteria bacterium]